MTTKELTQAFLEMPMIKKYWDKYQPVKIWECSDPVEIDICLTQYARKNYFTKTIQQIKKFADIQCVEYKKAQDETVSDCIRIWLKGTK